MIGNYAKPTNMYKKFIEWCNYRNYPIEYTPIGVEDWKVLKIKFINWDKNQYRVQPEHEEYIIHVFETGINA